MDKQVDKDTLYQQLVVEEKLLTPRKFEAFYQRLLYVKWAREHKGYFREFPDNADQPLPTWPVDFETTYTPPTQPLAEPESAGGPDAPTVNPVGSSAS